MSGWRNDPIKSTGFDAQIKHEDGFELHFYTDRLEAYRAVEKVCQEQIDRKPKTHGDEIRAMTDEELAQWLADCAYWISQYEGKAHPLLKMLQMEVKKEWEQDI